MLSKATVCLAALALMVTVSGMATPGHHVARSHHVLAARMASSMVDVPLEKRNNRTRCKPRPSTTSSSSTKTASVVGNVAADPTTTQASSSTHSSSSSTEHTSSKTTSSSGSSSTHSSGGGGGGSGGGGGGGGGGGNARNGIATFYYPADGNQVACGGFISNDDVIVAINSDLFNNFPGGSADASNSNPICGKTLTATYNGKSVTPRIMDICAGCDPNHIDMSPGALSQLDGNYQNDGQINIQWQFNFGY